MQMTRRTRRRCDAGIYTWYSQLAACHTDQTAAVLHSELRMGQSHSLSHQALPLHSCERPMQLRLRVYPAGVQ